MSYNITQLIKNAEKINIFKIFNCDEKYINGSASDFEWFDMWESAAFLCAGHKALYEYARELSELGVSPVDLSEHCRVSSIERWRATLDGGQTEMLERIPRQMPESLISAKYICKNLNISEKNRSFSFVDINKYVSDFTIDSDNISFVTERIYNIIKSDKNTCKILITDLSSGEYKRPDAYTANNLFLKKKSGEKLNSTEENIILTQTLVELLIKLREEKNIGILIKNTGCVSSATALAKYLDMRRLSPSRIWIEIGDVSDVESLSVTDIRTRPRPFVDTSHMNFSKEDLLRSFYLYPIGAFVFKGGRENVELLSAIKCVAQTEAHAEFLIESISI